MKRRAAAKPRGAAKAIEDAIEPIERLELLTYAARESFLEHEINPEAAQHLAVALDMIKSELVALRRALHYGDSATS